MAEPTKETTMLDLDTLVLERGSHESDDAGMCLLEAVAWVAGEDHSDAPECVSPALAHFGRGLNDALPDEPRQRLKPLIPRLIGTAGDPKLDQIVGLMAADWLIRTYTPAWLRLAKLTDDADALAGLPEITTWDALEAVTPRIREAQQRAHAAWDAAGDAAWYAAGDAAWDILKPTVAELQESAIGLFERMVEIAQQTRAAIEGEHG